MTVVYIDRVFLLNMILDYLLLLMTARLAGLPLRRKRFLFCAIFGGIYAGLVFLPALHFLGSLPVKVGMGILLPLLAFRKDKRHLKMIALFMLLSGALAGLVLGIGLIAGNPWQYMQNIYCAQIDYPVLLLSALFMTLFMRFVFCQGARHGQGEIITVLISINGKKKKVRTLYDTGNTLRDPINGKAVLVLERSALHDIYAEDIYSVITSAEAPEEKITRLYQEMGIKQFTLLPFRSVGVSGGLLLAVYSDYIQIGGKMIPRTLIALSDGPVSDSGGYQALWGGAEEGETTIETNPNHSTMDTQAQQAG